MTRLPLWIALYGSIAIPLVARAQSKRAIEFPVRQGVCGDAANVLYADRKRYTWPTTELTGDFHNRRCTDGSATLIVSASEVRLVVGGPSRIPHESTSGPTAREYFLNLARVLPGATAPQAIAAASISDSPPSIKELVDFAREAKISLEARRSALGWIPQLYRTSAANVLSPFVHDAELPWPLRERALQGVWESGESGVPILLALARSRQPERLRASSLRWLGQTPGDSAEAVLRAIADDSRESAELRSTATRIIGERNTKRHGR
jgi:hypothetical protein